MPKLLVKTGEKKGLVHRLSDKNTSIGRDPSNMIVLPDRRVSRSHARIVLRKKDYIIEDLNSTNGTLVNESAVTKQTLKVGDEIRLGSTVLAFLSLSAPEEQKVKKQAAQVKLIPSEQTPQGLTVEMKAIPEQVKPQDVQLLKPDVGSLQKAYQRLITLYRISSDLSTFTALPELLDRILELVLNVVKADRGFIMLIDEETKELTPQVVRKKKGLKEDEEITISKTIANQVLKTGEAVLTSDAMQDVRFKKAESVIHHGIRTAMCLPLKTKIKILGIMYVDKKAALLSFTKEDLELLTAICSQAAVVIENAKLFDGLRAANREIKQKQAQLIEAEKLSALGQLAGGVAHEINNPLASIIGFSELLYDKLAEGKIKPAELKKYVEYTNIVKEQGYRCKQIAQNLLQFARRKKVEMVSVDVNKIIEETLGLAQYHMRKVQIKLIRHLDPHLPRIIAEPNQLRQVFLNMVINARDAMEKGGTLTITTGKTKNNWIVVKFADTGCGISEDKLEQIFKPLYTTKEEGKGTGLGLSISLDIIEKHQGSIDVESVVNKGTTFSIKLPINS